MTEETWTRVASLASLDEDEPKAVFVKGKTIALYLLDGTVYASGNECTHAFAMLSEGYIEAGKIFCPLHQGSFDIKTGTAVDEPCEEPLETFEVRVEGDDVLVQL
ncbi:MAG: non-heme iron oxygenase ferredoxin subunit [Rhodospirillaceae bacterium]|nr:non-heme iron oxygenase ferredoxin subunit [Rhodospirillaceae bacterium]